MITKPNEHVGSIVNILWPLPGYSNQPIFIKVTS